jgi:AraC-like DNA-binding protein
MQKLSQFRRGIVFVILISILSSLVYASEEAEIKTNAPFFYVHMNFQEDWTYVYQARDIFLKECREQNIEPKDSADLFLIVFNSEIPLWGFGFKVYENVIAKPPLKKSNFNYTTFAHYAFTGTDGQIYNSIQHFSININNLGYHNSGPLIITWQDNKQREIFWPVEKTGKKGILDGSLYNIINFLIVFQFMFFAIFLFIYKKGRPLSNFIFAVFLVSVSLVFLNDIIYYFKSYILIRCPHLFGVGTSIVFLIPPALYFYTLSLIYRDFKFKKIHALNLIPFIFDFIFIAFKFHSNNADVKRELIVTGAAFNGTAFWIRTNIIHALVFGYIIAALLALRKYRLKIRDTYSFTERTNMSWLSWILIWYFSIELVYTTKHLVFLLIGQYFEILVLIANGSYLVFSVFVVYKGLRQPDIFNGIDENGRKQKYRKYLLPQPQKQYYLEKLLAFMDDAKPYLDPTLSMPDLAEKIPVAPHYLSQIINDSLNQNFFDFVNSYRIRESKKLLADISAHKKTILHILYETGFNSKSVFNEAFKKHTGMTPSEFRRQNNKN